MPEGDTVFRAAQLLDRALSGHTLTLGDLRVPQHATADLARSRVLETRSRGKHLMTRMTDPTGVALTLHTHLKMEGAWRVYRDGQRWKRPAHQARAVLGIPGTTAVGFSLGVVDLLPTSEEHTVVGHLGPDLLGPDWDAEAAVERLRREPERPVAHALLDQRNLAGVGNMYAAELCFVTGTHPLTPVGSVRDLPRMVAVAHRMLDVNKGRATQATTGDLREPRWVYGRERTPCRRCGTTIVVAMTGEPGRERATSWCPRCQPGPDPAP